jgi:hypothetical protein
MNASKHKRGRGDSIPPPCRRSASAQRLRTSPLPPPALAPSTPSVTGTAGAKIFPNSTFAGSGSSTASIQGAPRGHTPQESAPASPPKLLQIGAVPVRPTAKSGPRGQRGRGFERDLEGSVGGGGGAAVGGGAGAARGGRGEHLGRRWVGVGEERERERGGSAEVYIVFGKIQRARGAQPAVSRARCEAGAAAQLTPQPVSCELRHSGLVFRNFSLSIFLFSIISFYITG